MKIHGRGWRILGVAAATLLAACDLVGTSGGTIEANRAWGRATAPGQEVGAVYMTIRNESGENDRLVGGSTPAARAVEIHAMRMDGAIMRMRPQDGLDVPAGGTAQLEPGGTHLMLVGLKAPLRAGQTIPLTLDFANAGRKQVRVKVRPIGSAGPTDDNE